VMVVREGPMNLGCGKGVSVGEKFEGVRGKRPCLWGGIKNAGKGSKKKKDQSMLIITNT